MTIETSITEQKYLGNGTDGPWSINFPITEPDDVSAIITDQDGVDKQLVYNRDYTVTQRTGPNEIGGTASVLVPIGSKILFYLNVDITQEVDLKNSGKTDVNQIEFMSDKLTLICLQLLSDISRSVKVSRTSDVDPDQIVTEIERLAAQVSIDTGKVEQAVSNLFQRKMAPFTTTPGQRTYTLDFPVDPNLENIDIFLGAVPQYPGDSFTIASDGMSITFNEDPGAERCYIRSSLSYANPDLDAAITNYLTTAEQRIIYEGNKQVGLTTQEGVKQVGLTTDAGKNATDEIESDRSNAVSQIESVKNTAIAEVERLPNYTRNYGDILNGLMEQLRAGTLSGTEGKWKFDSTQSFVCSGTVLPSSWGEISTGVMGGGLAFGSGNSIVEHTYGIIVGDSGLPYKAVHGSTNGVYLHPKHGNVTSDFTAGNKYTLYIFKESSSPQDKMIGDLDVVEYSVGNNLAYNGMLPHTKTAALPSDYKAQGWNIQSGRSVTVTMGNISITSATPVQGIAAYKCARHYVKPGNTVTITGTSSVAVQVVLSWYTTSGGVSGNTTVVSTATTNLNTSFVVPSSVVESVYEIIFRADTHVTAIDLAGFTMSVDVDTVNDVIPPDSHATLNAGYWNGKDWNSQLLEDIYTGGDNILLKLGRKSTGTTNRLVVDKLEVRKINGTWHTYDPAYPPGQGDFAGDIDKNTALVNVKQSAIGLGYSSTADMLANSAVRASYKVKSRVLRPDDSNVASPIVDDKVYMLAGTYGFGIPTIMHDMIDHVPAIDPGSNTNWSTVVSSADGGQSKSVGYVKYNDSVNPRYADTNGAAALFRLINKDGFLWIQARMKELINDNGDWGDSHQINEDGSDKITTYTDDNGNVGLRGVLSYKTGIQS